jgi:hypothetical protein
MEQEDPTCYVKAAGNGKDLHIGADAEFKIVTSG